jgi:hypothetical protein
MSHETPLIQEYIGQTAAATFKLVESNSDQVGDIPNQQIRLLIDEDDVETSAFGILYSVTLLSFLQARPAGVSVIDFREQDVWSVEDLFRHLSYKHGSLHFYADYVRGRLMKTTVEISKDGTLVIETSNRADEATQWVEYLLGKRGILDFISEKGLGTIQ